MKMRTMYRSPEEVEFYAKLKADRAAAPKVEAPVYVAPPVDPRVALMPARFAGCEEQAAWCAGRQLGAATYQKQEPLGRERAIAQIQRARIALEASP